MRSIAAFRPHPVPQPAAGHCAEVRGSRLASALFSILFGGMVALATWQRQYGIPAMTRSEGRMASLSRSAAVADRRNHLGKFCPRDSVSA